MLRHFFTSAAKLLNHTLISIYSVIVILYEILIHLIFFIILLLNKKTYDKLFIFFKFFTIRSIYDFLIRSIIFLYKRFEFVILFFSSVFVVIIILSFIIFPRVYNIYNIKSIQNADVYSSDRVLINRISDETRSYMPLSYIPIIVRYAFISAEDKNFYYHKGFDCIGIVRAIIHNVFSVLGLNNGFMGASTISQQVVKNMLLSNERTLWRKLKEAMLTIGLEFNNSKDHILELYLNKIFLGRKIYGVSIASLAYFNKPISELRISEVAMLAALPKAPSYYDPIKHYKHALIRRNWVIKRMYAEGYISTKERDEALSDEIKVFNNNSNLNSGYNLYSNLLIEKFTHNYIGKKKIKEGGYVIKTTINNKYQKYAQEALQSGIEHLDHDLGYRGAYSNVFYDNNLINDKSNEDNTTLANEQNHAKSDKEIEFAAKITEYFNKYTKLDPNTSYYNVNDSSAARDISLMWRSYLLNSKRYPYTKKNIFKGIVLRVNKFSIDVGLSNGEVISVKSRYNRWAMRAPKLADDNITTVGILQLKSFKEVFHDGDIILLHKLKYRPNNAYRIYQIPEINGAIMAVNPLNGHVLAMQGGYSPFISQYNRALDAYRQPGSIFKAFVFLTALESGLSPNDIVLDAPIADFSNNDYWMPKNSDHSSKGYITMRKAMELSRNLATLRLAKRLGLSKVSATANIVGVYDSPITNFTHILGSKETTLSKLVQAFSTIANYGSEHLLYFITSIQDYKGETVYRHNHNYCQECNNIKWNPDIEIPSGYDNIKSFSTNINAVSSYMLISLMQGVVKHGSGARARVSGFNIAGKTGTTNNGADMWFIGMIPEVVVGVYLGYDKPRPVYGGYGGKYAAPIFRKFMQKISNQYDALVFRVPDGVAFKHVNPDTGELAVGAEDSILEVFRDTRGDDTDSDDDNIDDDTDSVESIDALNDGRIL